MRTRNVPGNITNLESSGASKTQNFDESFHSKPVRFSTSLFTSFLVCNEAFLLAAPSNVLLSDSYRNDAHSNPEFTLTGTLREVIMEVQEEYRCLTNFSELERELRELGMDRRDYEPQLIDELLSDVEAIRSEYGDRVGTGRHGETYEVLEGDWRGSYKRSENQWLANWATCNVS